MISCAVGGPDLHAAEQVANTAMFSVKCLKGHEQTEIRVVAKPEAASKMWGACGSRIQMAFTSVVHV
jgi:hypothetical protein